MTRQILIAAFCALFATTAFAGSNPAAVITVPTIASLRAIPAVSGSQYFTVEVDGYYVAGDFGPPETFLWSSGSSASDNGCTVINPTGNVAVGRYILAWSGTLNIQQCGAKGDSSTDNSTAIQTTATAVNANGGTMFVPSSAGRFQFATGFTVSNPVYIRGSGQLASILRYTGTGTAINNTGVNNPIGMSDITLDGSGANATLLDLARTQFGSLQNVRFRALASGITAISANVTDNSWNPYFDVVNGAIFDSVGTAILLNSSSAQAANRWQIVNVHCVDVVNCIDIEAAQGTTIENLDASENTGDEIVEGASANGVQATDITEETSSGGTMFAINAAANRNSISNIAIFAGTLGLGSGCGLRCTITGGFDLYGLAFSSASSALISAGVIPSSAIGIETYGTTAVAVTSLPTCNAAATGVKAYVTDSNATLTAGIGAIVANGGANHVPVGCDGTNWRIGG